MRLSGIFSSDGANGILEEKGNRCIDMVYPYSCEYVDKAIGYIAEAELTKVDTMCSEILLEVYSRSSKGNTDLKARMSSF